MPFDVYTKPEVDVLVQAIPQGPPGAAAPAPAIVSDMTENVATLPINGAHQVVYSIEVPDLAPSDVVLLIPQWEVTNNNAFNVGIGRTIVCGTTPTDTDQTAGVTQVIRANMDNVTPANHHWAKQNFGVITGLTGTKRFNMVLYAVASGGNGNIIVEQNYGSLKAVVFRGAV